MAYNFKVGDKIVFVFTATRYGEFSREYIMSDGSYLVITQIDNIRFSVVGKTLKGRAFQFDMDDIIDVDENIKQFLQKEKEWDK